MEKMDNFLHDSLEKILNIPLTDLDWTQATLPIQIGGLGTRKKSDIALPAFLASAHGCLSLVFQLLPK